MKNWLRWERSHFTVFNIIVIKLICFTGKEETENERANIVGKVEEHTFKIAVFWRKLANKCLQRERQKVRQRPEEESGEEKMMGWRRVGEKKISIISINHSVLLPRCSLTHTES